MPDINSVFLRCDENSETVVFKRYTSHDDSVRYEIVFEDSYREHANSGIAGRLKRAWHAFWAKPVSYAGVYAKDEKTIETFLRECLRLTGMS